MWIYAGPVSSRSLSHLSVRWREAWSSVIFDVRALSVAVGVVVPRLEPAS